MCLLLFPLGVSGEEGECTPTTIPLTKKIMWTTPIESMQLLPSPISPSYLSLLSSSCLHEFKAFSQDDELVGKYNHSFEASPSMNDLFFLHQVEASKGSSTLLGSLSQAFKPLIGVLQDASHGYLRSIGVDGLKLSESPQMFSWCTVQSEGSSHLPHIHQDAVVSGVIFLKIPPHQAGELYFEVDWNSHMLLKLWFDRTREE